MKSMPLSAAKPERVGHRRGERRRARRSNSDLALEQRRRRRTRAGCRNTGTPGRRTPGRRRADASGRARPPADRRPRRRPTRARRRSAPADRPAGTRRARGARPTCRGRRPSRRGLSSQRRLERRPGGRSLASAERRSRAAASVRMSRMGFRTRRRTDGGLPSSRRPRASAATASGWFSKFEVYAARPASHRARRKRPRRRRYTAGRAPGAAAAPPPPRAGRRRRTRRPRSRGSRRGQAEAASARVDTPAITTCSRRSAIAESEPAPRGRRGDHVQMVQHRSRRLFDPQPIDHGAMRARPSSRRRSGRRLARPALPATRSRRAGVRRPVRASAGSSAALTVGSAAMRPESTISSASGAALRSCRAARAAPSTYASQRDRLERRIVPHHRGHAALEQRRLGHLAGQEGHLAVERAGGPPADRAARPAETVDDLPARDREARGERAAQLEQHQRDASGRHPAAPGTGPRSPAPPRRPCRPCPDRPG